ncbi:hypothetical protein COB72_03410 [bacterium]|nr:MAG: hypothetical protein COB72_03410 [bacterium]
MSKSKPASQAIASRVEGVAINPNSNLTARMESLNREGLIYTALRGCEPGTKPGGASKCWKLGVGWQVEAATKHILEQKSGNTVHAEMQTAMDDAEISARVLSRWLKAVKQEYTKAHDRYLNNVKSTQDIGFAKGDLMAMLCITMAKVAPKYTAWFEAGEIAELGNKDCHLMVRFMEMFTTAAKVQVDAERSNAQRQLILSKLQASTEKLGNENMSQEDREDQLSEVTKLIQAVMGVREAA